MNKHIIIRRTLILFLPVFLVHNSLAHARQQDQNKRPTVQVQSIHWGYHRPGEIVAARMHAHADQMRSFGWGASQYGDGLIKREQAISMRLDNQLKAVLTYYDIKRARKQYHEETHYDVREKQMLLNSRKWQEIKSLPELTNTTSGIAHNFLLDRLSNTILTFQMAGEEGKLNDERWLNYLQLEPEVYDHLWLEQGGAKFAATNGKALDVSWWPFVLRESRFDVLRQEFIAVRNRIAEDSSPRISFEDLRELDEAQIRFANTVWKVHAEERKARNSNRKPKWTTDQRLDWIRAKKFLQGKHLEIRRLKETQSRDLLTGQLRFNPESSKTNFISFLNFMTRNGLEFAPASKESESIAAYNTTFGLMRDLYALAADEDAAVIDPKEKYKTRQ